MTSLLGGKDGLECYRVLSSTVGKNLRNGGFLVLEIGYSQKNQVSEIFSRTGEWSLFRMQKDLAGNDRCLVFQKKLES